MADLVLDASAMVDLLLGGPLGAAVARRIAGHGLHGPGHLELEVLSAIGRLARAGQVDEVVATGLVGALSEAPVAIHPTRPLVAGAWARRGALRLADAVTVELADQLSLALVTTDRRLAPQRVAEVVTA